MSRLVVIGGGGAGTGAATIAIQTDRSMKVSLLTEFEDIAYSPCGIPYVFGKEIDSFDGLFLQPAEFYQEMGIDLRTSTVVDGIDMGKRVVRTTTGEEFPFDQLIICTGWEYEVPKVPNVDLNGIVYIKNIRRAMEINKRLDEVKKAVVWQAKPLGVELIEALPHRGIETHLVDSGSWLLSDFADADMMEPLQQHLVDELGVKLHFGTELLGFEGQDGKLTTVRTSGGDIEADMAFLVANMKPATRLAKSIGVKTGSTGAIVVDNHMRTNVDGVFAAGACVETMHGLLKIPVNLIPGTYAYTQGRMAGANAAGGDEAYRPVYVPWGLGAKIQVGGALVSENLAKATGMPYVVGKATGITAARYHPSHEKMQVKLLFDPSNRQIIGGQFTGGDGVKERADFLAFAIRKGTSAEELATMENVYSPPIGALGEPIAAAAKNALTQLGPR
ncbi:MAG: FAD-dependent oxidoreductase [Deltaproteobacteria bacterium]|nr:FAD-dependent oxidoreductase [Deltaproteobacteria bacterium]